MYNEKGDYMENRNSNFDAVKLAYLIEAAGGYGFVSNENQEVIKQYLDGKIDYKSAIEMIKNNE